VSAEERGPSECSTAAHSRHARIISPLKISSLLGVLV
jgi:hypothetical protein